MEGSGVAAVILAAGMSRRMGTPKQLLRIGGRGLLEHVLENVRRSRVEEVVLVLGFAAEEIQRGLSLAGVKTVLNPAYEAGMGTSLRTGLAALGERTRAALVVLADQPFVQPATLDRLIVRHARLQAESVFPQIVLPLYKGFRGNPVLLDRSVFPELMSLNGDVGCRAIFGSHLENIVKVEVDDPGILLDIDSQEDFEKLGQANHHGLKVTEADLESREMVSDAPDLVVVGRESLAMALAALGRVLRFTVTVVDPWLTLGEAPQADRVLRVLDFTRLPPERARYIVVASQGRFDEEAVEQALRTQASYVALVAGKGRAQEVVRSLAAKGVPEAQLARLRSPAGLDLGAETPEEIALSILAEIVAERRRGAPDLKHHSRRKE